MSLKYLLIVIVLNKSQCGLHHFRRLMYDLHLFKCLKEITLTLMHLFKEFTLTLFSNQV